MEFAGMKERERGKCLFGRAIDSKFYCAISSQIFTLTFRLHPAGMNGQFLQSGAMQEKIVPTYASIFLPLYSVPAVSKRLYGRTIKQVARTL
jgi:hypothetical protein